MCFGGAKFHVVRMMREGGGGAVALTLWLVVDGGRVVNSERGCELWVAVLGS